MWSCLAAAALWAIAVALFRPLIEQHGPAAVNLGKSSLAALAFASATLFLGATPDVAARPGLWLLVALSGFVGMAMGDSLLFFAIRAGGVQRTLVIFNTSPLLAALAAVPIYGERPTGAGWLGIALILAGVTLVETDRVRIQGTAADRAITPGGGKSGAFVLVAGLGAAACQAAGIIMNRGPLQEIGLVPASATRLGAASLGLLILLALYKVGRRALRPLGSFGVWQRLSIPAFLGTVIAVYLMMRGIRDVPAATSAALLATTPIFSLPIARFVLHEAIGVRSVLGTLVGVAGVALLNTG